MGQQQAPNAPEGKSILYRHCPSQALEMCSDSFPSVPALSVARETVLLDEHCSLPNDVCTRASDGVLAMHLTFDQQQEW